jgi:acetyl-CoA synthetase
MNISGHRISTTEVEHALVGDPRVAEAAVVGASDPTTGQAIVAFVTVKGDAVPQGGASGEGEKLVEELRNGVARAIGPIAKPRQILLTPELPKTRSGKIMRRLLRDVAENRELGDVTTLLDPTVVNLIDQQMQASPAGADE